MIDLLAVDGDVPVTNAQNVTTIVPSFPKLRSMVTSLTDTLTGAVAEARDINSQSLAFSVEAQRSADAAALSADAAKASEAALAQAVIDTSASELAAARSASKAADSQAAALASAVASEASRVAAKASEDAAASSRDTAGFSAAAAQSYRDDAKLARDMASSYANAPVNSEVSPGKYSAYHWAEQARLAAVGVVVYKGSWDASGSTMPTLPKLGDFYFISKAGTVGGVKWSAGDMAVFDGTLWERIDNQQAVTTVAGRTGAVSLTIADIASLQASLDAKLGKNEALNVFGTNKWLLNNSNGGASGTDVGVFSAAYGDLSLVARGWAQVLTLDSNGLNHNGKTVWTAANFDPSTKANLTNPVFTGTVTLSALNVRGAWGAAADMQTPNNYRFLIRDYGTNGITLDAVNPANSVYAPLNLTGTAVTINNQTAWHAGNFDPNSKASLSGAVFTGTVIASNTSFRAQGWGGTATDGVVYFGSSNSYIYKQGGQFSFANEQGGYTASLNSGGTIWTTANVTPLDRNNGGTLNGSIFMANQTGEKRYGWVFSNRTAYLYGNPSTADVGLYDTAGGYRWRTDASNNFYVGNSITAGGAVSAPSFNPYSSAGAYLSGNGSGMQWNGAFYLAGTGYYWNAAGTGWARMPRMFVQGNDPGGGAYDGDLWIW